MKRWHAHVLCVGECNGRPKPWQHAWDSNSPLRKVLEPLNWQIQAQPDAWHEPKWGRDRAQAGRDVLQFIVSYHLPAFGGETKPLTPLVIISHRGGCDAVAHGLDWVDSGGLSEPACPAWRAPMNQTEADWMTRRPVCWIAVSPHVRETMMMVYTSAVASLRQRNGNYHGLTPYREMPRFCLQVNTPNFLRPKPRRIAHHGYSPAVVMDGPRGVLKRADQHEDWWRNLVGEVNQVFKGGRPVFPEAAERRKQ